MISNTGNPDPLINANEIEVAQGAARLATSVRTKTVRSFRLWSQISRRRDTWLSDIQSPSTGKTIRHPRKLELPMIAYSH